MPMTEVGEARRILGDAMLGPQEISACLGPSAVADLRPHEHAALDHVPFDRAALERAAADDLFLVLRVPRDAAGPLTIVALGERLPDALDPRVHTGVGYALRDEWTIDTQALGTTETCAFGWALVHKTPLPGTLNRSRDAQDAVLDTLPAGDRPPRRSAVEAVYDTLLWRHARGERLLANAWDWSRSDSTDAGYAAVGDHGERGLRIIAYSPAVRFGTLGVCLQR
jgi:hypothetical protein